MVCVEITKYKGVRCRLKMLYLRLIPITPRPGWRGVDVGNDQLCIPYFSFMVNSSRWGSDTTLVTMVVWKRLSIYEWRWVILRHGHGIGPSALWHSSGYRGSWISMRAFSPVSSPLWLCFSTVLLLVQSVFEL